MAHHYEVFIWRKVNITALSCNFQLFFVLGDQVRGEMTLFYEYANSNGFNDSFIIDKYVSLQFRDV